MTNGKGVCIWFTGRSGGGKSTITNQLVPLLEENGRTITILDVVPLIAKQWCEKTSEGKLMRKGFVAKEVVRHGGVAICVTVSARQEVRQAVRELIGSDNFVEVYVDVPPEVAAARKKRRTKKTPLLKQIRFFVRRVLNALPFRESRTYAAPVNADLIFDTTRQPPEETARAIFDLLIERGFVVPQDAPKVSSNSPQTAVAESALPT